MRILPILFSSYFFCLILRLFSFVLPKRAKLHSKGWVFRLIKSFWLSPFSFVWNDGLENLYRRMRKAHSSWTRVASSSSEPCHLDHFGSEKRFSEPFSLSTEMRFLRGDRESGKHLLTACSYLFDNFGLRYKVHDCYRYDISYHIQDWCPNKPRHIEEHCPIVRNECTNNNDQKQKPKGQWG